MFSQEGGISGRGDINQREEEEFVHRVLGADGWKKTKRPVETGTCRRDSNGCLFPWEPRLGEAGLC